MDSEGNYLISLSENYERLLDLKQKNYAISLQQKQLDEIAYYADPDTLFKDLGGDPANWETAWYNRPVGDSSDLEKIYQTFQTEGFWTGDPYQAVYDSFIDYGQEYARWDTDKSNSLGLDTDLLGTFLADGYFFNGYDDIVGPDGTRYEDATREQVIAAITDALFNGIVTDESSPFYGLELVDSEYYKDIMTRKAAGDIQNSDLVTNYIEEQAIPELIQAQLDYLGIDLDQMQLDQLTASIIEDFNADRGDISAAEYYKTFSNNMLFKDGFFQNYIDTIPEDILNANEEINAIYSKRETYSLDEYKEALQEAGASDEIINLAVEKWKEDTFDARDRFMKGFNSLKEREDGSVPFDTDGKMDRIKNEIAPYLLDSVLSQFEYAMRNIDTDEAGAEAAVNALATFYNSINELGPEAEYIAANADLTSLSGIEAMFTEMEAAGIDISGLDLSSWINTLTVNLDLEWETYSNKIAEGMKSFEEAIANASEGMDLEEAIAMANKLGVTLDDFRFEDGKYFFDNIELVIQEYRDYSERLRENIQTETDNMRQNLSQKADRWVTFSDGEFTFAEEVDAEFQAFVSSRANEYAAWLEKNGKEHSSRNLTEFLTSELDELDDNTIQMIEEYEKRLTAMAYLSVKNLAKFFETLGLTAEEQAQILEALKTGDTSNLTGRALDIYYEYEDDLTDLITSTISDMTDAALEAISTGKTQRVDITNLADYNPELAGKISRGELDGVTYQTSGDNSRAYALIDPNISEEAYKIFLEGLNYGPEEYNEAMVDFFDARRKDIEGALESVLSDSNNIDYATIADFATSLGYTVDELLGKEIFSLNPDDLTYHISDYSALEQEVRGKVTYAQEMIADSISDFLDSTLELVSNGISGSLTHVEFSQLGEYIAKITGKQLDLQFIETSEGLKLTQASVLQIYSSLKDVDSLAAKVVLDELAESAMDSDERLNNIYNVTKDIADLNDQIESAKPNSKRKEMLEAELALAENIRDTLLEAGNAFNFMNQDLPTSLSNPLSLWEGAGDALKILDGDEFKNGTGYIDYTDFYNMINMMEQMGVDLSTVATSVNGNTVSAMELLKAAGQSMTIVDGVPMVSLTNFGESFKLDTEGMRNGIAEGIHTLASEQIELIDSQIAILETVVAMEKIGDELDVDQSGLIDLDEILSPDKKSFSEGAENYLDYLEYFAGEITVDGLNLEAALASLDPQKLMEFFNGLQTLIKDTDWSNAEEASKAIRDFITTFFFGSEVNFDQSNFGSFGGAISQQWDELTGEFKYIINGKEVLKEQWDDLINNLNTMASDYADVLTGFGFVIPENFEGTVAQVLELNGMINPTDAGFFIDGLPGGPWETREAAIEAWIEANGLEGLESTGATYNQDSYSFGNDTFETLTLDVGGVSIEREYRIHDAGDGNLQYLYNGDVYSSLEALKASIMLFEGDYNDGDFININDGETSKTYTVRTENGLQYLVELDSEGNEVGFIVNGQETDTPEGVTAAVEQERQEAEAEAAAAAAAGSGEGEAEVASTEMAVKITPVSVSVEATDGEGNLTVTEEITSAKATVAELIITPTEGGVKLAEETTPTIETMNAVITAFTVNPTATSLAEDATIDIDTGEGTTSITVDKATIAALSADGVISENGTGGFKLNGTLAELEAKIAELEMPANLVKEGDVYTLSGAAIQLSADVVSKLAEKGGILTPTEGGYTLNGTTVAEAELTVAQLASKGLLSLVGGVYTFTGNVKDIDLDINGDPATAKSAIQSIIDAYDNTDVTLNVDIRVGDVDPVLNKYGLQTDRISSAAQTIEAGAQPETGMGFQSGIYAQGGGSKAWGSKWVATTNPAYNETGWSKRGNKSVMTSTEDIINSYLSAIQSEIKAGKLITQEDVQVLNDLQTIANGFNGAESLTWFSTLQETLTLMESTPVEGNGLSATLTQIAGLPLETIVQAIADLTINSTSLSTLSFENINNFITTLQAATGEDSVAQTGLAAIKQTLEELTAGQYKVDLLYNITSTADQEGTYNVNIEDNGTAETLTNLSTALLNLNTQANALMQSANAITSTGPDNVSALKDQMNVLPDKSVEVGNTASAIDKLKDKSIAVGNTAAAIDKLKSKSITASITVKITAPNPTPGSTTNSTVRLTSNAKGNVALAKGTGKAAAKGKTLMGELGPELVVSDGRYFTVGNNGAEFVDLPSDAIVFNHLQTQKLLGAGGTVGTGEPVTNERNAVALAGGNVTGPAMASAADALAELYKLRAMWEGLLNASAQELGKKGAGLGSGNKPGGGGGGDGGGGGGGGDGEATNLHDLERWYNLMRQIAKLEQQVTLEQAKRNNMRNGADINKSREKELKLLEKQRDANKELAEQQKKYYDERRNVLNSTDYSKIFTYDEDGLMQYVSGEDRGLDALSKLNATDKNGKPLMSSKDQLKYLKETLGFDISTLKTNADGTKTSDPEQMMQNFWDGIDGWMGEMDGLYDSYNDAAIAMEEATSAMNDLIQEQIDNQISVEEKMLKALEGQRQAAIDSIQEEKDLLEAAAQEYIDGLSSALEKERSMYDKNESQAETEKLQRRLAILQRSGGSASEIKSLQDQIDSRLKDAYFEEQQAQIDAIQEASNNEIEKLQNQIDLMTETLEYQKENGLLWTEIYEMMNTWTPEQLLQYIIENDPDYQSGSPTQNEENANQTRIELEDWANKREEDRKKQQQEKEWNDYYNSLDKYSQDQKSEHA